MSESGPGPGTYYARSLARRGAELEKSARLSFGISMGRLACFLGGAAAGGAAIWQHTPGAGVAAGLGFAGFVVLVVWHAQVVLREDRVKAAILFAERGISRVADEIDKLPARGERFSDVAKGAPSYGGDLDLWGKRSILQRLDAMETDVSEGRLARWLSEPATPGEIRARQAAVEELGADPEFCEMLFVHARGGAERDPDLPAFLRWCGGKTGEGVSLPLLTALGVVLPVITLTLLFVPGPLGVPSWAWLVPGVLQAVVALRVRGMGEQGLAAALRGARGLARNQAVITHLEAKKPRAKKLQEIADRLLSGEAPASRGVAALDRLAGFIEARESGLFAVVIGPMMLYDLHLFVALVRWQRTYGRAVDGWMNALGDLLALAGMGVYRFDNPESSFPEIVEGPSCFQATMLAHPLLPRSRRVANDVMFAGPGTALLVTGSNMSGKSTLMRSIGVAAVMAQAGAPVAATSLTMSPLAVRTSIRVSDSLAEGVSHFYAELLALRRVVEDSTRGDVLFLLDEILHGTNSRERQIGSKSVIAYLLDHGAMGAVSTHDLGLAELATDMPERVRPVHLLEEATGDQMTFDYRVREGVLTSGNALALMRQLGLPVGPPT